MPSKDRKIPKRSKRNLRMKEDYLNKDTCRKRAQKLITYNEWKNVTVEQIAKEIYGHAYVYYCWNWMKKLPLIHYLIYRHVEDGIDVEDQVDTFQFVWEWIWKR